MPQHIHNFTIKLNILVVAVFIMSICLIQCVSANGNSIPAQSDEVPVDNLTNISISISMINVTIEDLDGDTFNWTIQTSPDIGSDSVTDEENGSKSCSISGLAYSTTYIWFVNVTDGTGWCNETYHFTTAEENGGEEPPFVQAPIEIFPSPPKSGSSVAIYFTNESAGLSADGFLHVNSFIYRVEMEDGFGIVELDREAYGHATLYLFGSAITEEDSTKEFDIEKGIGKDLRVSITGTATINSDVTATVTYGGSSYGSQEVSVTSPSDEMDTYITDNQGGIEFKVDEIGKWRIMLMAEGQIATGSVTAEYGLLPLGIIEEDPPQVGDSITIVTEPEAHIEVFIDAEIDGDYIASGDGFISLSIIKGGRYSLEGRLGNLRGKYSFQVPEKAVINILDPATRTLVEQVENKKRYIIEVTNPAGRLIEDAESLWIANPMGTKELLPLTDGVGTWNTYQIGSYMLSVDDTSSYASNSRYVLIRPPVGEFGWVTGILVAVFSLFILLGLLIVYSKKRGIPLKLVLNSISGLIFRKSKRQELPIG